ncbi:hypothetical protein, partial [Paracoccus tibetensis]|uniref:hypothetical protein n=1 Tax=Paracoccus tibetensis TaxID=336292 RepID=UPI001C31C3AA
PRPKSHDTSPRKSLSDGFIVLVQKLAVPEMEEIEKEETGADWCRRNAACPFMKKMLENKRTSALDLAGKTS